MKVSRVSFVDVTIVNNRRSNNNKNFDNTLTTCIHV